MKFLSFMRTPKYQRFHIEPRYYDPVKEDIERRTREIKDEMAFERAATPGSNLRGSFSKKTKHTYESSSSRQLIIIVVLVALVIGYLEYGNNIIHVFWLALPLYLYYRLKQKTGTRG